MVEDGKFSKSELKFYAKEIGPLKRPLHMKEKFKQIKLDDKWSQYLISSYGRVFTTNWHSNTGLIREMRTHLDKDGYVIVNLYVEGKQYTQKVHRLVAFNFVLNLTPKKRNYVNHKNTHKDDNHRWNLEWVTNAENIEHARKHDLIKPLKAEECAASTHTNDEIITVCKLLEANVPIKEISKMTGISYHIVYDVLTRRKWVSISKDYDFSTYTFGRDVELVHKICKLLEEGELTQTQIANEVGCTVQLVHSILTEHSDKNISQYYDFSKYTNSRQTKHKKHKRKKKLRKVS